MAEASAASEAASTTAAPFRPVLLISAGASHSVALLSGNIVCSWGRGEDGQLGHGDAEDRLSPTQLSALDGHEIVSVTCGADHTTAYSESCMEVYSWGWGDFGRLGHGNSSDLFTPLPIKALHSLRVKQIACGDSHCLAVTVEGEVQSWGRNQNGQLGLGTTEDSLVPQKLQAFEGVSIKMVAAGAEHSVAVAEDGELYGWGWGRYGNLGLGDRNDRLIPEKVATVDREKMVMVACGWRHTISVSSSGRLYSYGWSKYGQLGHGDFKDHLVPCQLEALRESFISQVIFNPSISLIMVSESRVVGDTLWQSHLMENFMAGDGIRHILVTVAPENWLKWPMALVFSSLGFPPLTYLIGLFSTKLKVVQISCGWRHTLAVTERQNVFSWGRGTNGQLGHGESSDRNSPKIIEPLSLDGSKGQNIASSKYDPSSGKTWVSPSERYAVVPDDTVQGQTSVTGRGNGSEVSVPEGDVKRIRELRPALFATTQKAKDLRVQAENTCIDSGLMTRADDGSSVFQ
ncbi:Ultraviolet-B receptor UVR8 [Citrus sinensis]|uniref:Ultraviolet-B receptor UVR8 n=1 Tax=Citrus sinensis TaxID=2711 RepID=A0ACB8JIX9_CITSI|nr:Ultraviolet-B receptor UVR8 [Citrus sinensis]